MRLNNRIYFRDHQSSEYSNRASLPVSKKIQVRATSTVVTSRSSVVPQVEPQPQVPGNENIPLYSVSPLGNLDDIKSNDAGTG